ncbi:MAG: PQQ-binding-like beta-propeller repeat protein [Planctomycetes bacterium]|nr:PQQ-binding-like beta-propeller repeat protein [Planctomycetota bacterium]
MRALLALCLIVAYALPARGGESPWPALRGSCAGEAAITWQAPATAPAIREWHFKPLSDRRFQVGLPVWASPAVAIIDDRPVVYIGGYDQKLHALDLSQKTRLWFQITNGPILEAPAIGYLGNREIVFYSSADRSVYACDARTGRKLWTRELVAPSNTLGFCWLSAPFLHEGVLYITCFAYDRALARNAQSGWLVALEMRTGSEHWRREISQGFLSSPTGRIIAGRLHLYVAARKGLLQAFHASSEGLETLWSFQMAHEVLGSPVIETDGEQPRLFLGSKFGRLVALDAKTGEMLWKRMAGNWIDNTACVATVEGESMVLVGSHDYNLYAFRAHDGEMLWRKRFGGEVYSAPSFFYLKGEPLVAAASLDDHLYVLNARDGSVHSIFFTGQAVWDKVSKGETLWGSPVALEMEDDTVIIQGSYSGLVYTLPLLGECSLRSKMQAASTLWIGLGVMAALFLLIILPVLLLSTRPHKASRQAE